MDIRDILLEAAAEVQEAVREMMEELVHPQRLLALRAMWMQAPDEMKEEFAQTHPDEYRMLMDEMNE